MLIAGTNKFASQKGMSIGSIRHVSDIDTGKFSQESQGVLNQQLGTGKFATQKGMAMGKTRHVADIDAGQLSQSSQGFVGLQAGTNKFATQKGMSMGKGRGISDTRITQVYDEYEQQDAEINGVGEEIVNGDYKDEDNYNISRAYDNNEEDTPQVYGGHDDEPNGGETHGFDGYCEEENNDVSEEAQENNEFEEDNNDSSEAQEIEESAESKDVEEIKSVSEQEDEDPIGNGYDAELKDDTHSYEGYGGEESIEAY